MRPFLPLVVVVVFSLLMGGCSFFKRDLKSSDASADAGGALIAQRDSSIDSGPSEGVVGLEKAPADSFDWNQQGGGLSTKSATAQDSPLPPRDPDAESAPGNTLKPGTGDIWSTPPSSPSTRNISEQIADALSSAPPEGSAIEPSPVGKPLNQTFDQKMDSIGSKPETSTKPITQTSPLVSTPEIGSHDEVGSLSLRSTSPSPSGIVGPPIDLPSLNDSQTTPGFKTISEDASQSPLSIRSQPPDTPDLEALSRETDKQAANLARAIKPSSLSENSLTNSSSPAMPPATGFQRLDSTTNTGPSTNSPQRDIGPSATEIPVPARPSPNEPERNLLAMAGDGKTSMDSSPPSPIDTAAAPSGPLPDAQTLKQQGIQQYREKKYDQAIQSFRRYLSAYPDEDQEIEWRLAQSLFLGNRWGEAEKEFDKLRGSPRPEFRADAILKLGMIDQKRGNMEGAREQWRRVVESYPKTDAATRASRLLAETP